MWDTTLALLFLAAGYLFVSRWTVTRTASLRSTQNPQYFYAAIAAAFIYLLASMAIAALRNASPLVVAAVTEVSGYVGDQITLPEQQRLKILKQLRHFAMAAVMAWTLPYVLDFPLKRNHRLVVAIFSRFNVYTRFETLVASVRGRLPLMFTQSTGKVYVGFVTSESAYGIEVGEWLSFEPFLSGYRDEQNRFLWTTNYLWLHKPEAHKTLSAMGMSKEDFEITIPMSTITSAHPFDLDAYFNLFDNSNETKAPISTLGKLNNKVEGMSQKETQNDASSGAEFRPYLCTLFFRLTNKIRTLRDAVYRNNTVQRSAYWGYILSVFATIVTPAYGGWPWVTAFVMLAVAAFLLTTTKPIDAAG